MCKLFPNYPTSQFDLRIERTPFSTWTEVLSIVGLYYVVIFGGQAPMSNRKSWNLGLLVPAHNLLLSVTSGLLLLLYLEEILPTIAHNGLLYAMCTHAGGWTRRLVVLYYANYVMKYFELLDTIFLMLQKKPLRFLHCYHHGATVLLCYTQLAGRTSLSWVPITLNLAVHVIMYMYYFLASLGIRVRWKQFVTRFQIVQFVLDLGFIYFSGYNYFAATYKPGWPNYGTCAGEESAAITGAAILTSYLVLFVKLYLDIYKKPRHARRLESLEKVTSTCSTEINVDVNRGSAKACTAHAHSVSDIPRERAQPRAYLAQVTARAKPLSQSLSRGWRMAVQGGDAQEDDDVPYVQHIEYAG